MATPLQPLSGKLEAAAFKLSGKTGWSYYDLTIGGQVYDVSLPPNEALPAIGTVVSLKVNDYNRYNLDIPKPEKPAAPAGGKSWSGGGKSWSGGDKKPWGSIGEWERYQIDHRDPAIAFQVHLGVVKDVYLAAIPTLTKSLKTAADVVAFLDLIFDKAVDQYEKSKKLFPETKTPVPPVVDNNTPNPPVVEGVEGIVIDDLPF